TAAALSEASSPRHNATSSAAGGRPSVGGASFVWCESYAGMPVAEIVAGLLIVALVLYDVFQTVIVPRPSTSGIGVARYVIAATWPPWRRYCESIRSAGPRGRRPAASRACLPR